eukprot:PhM_4_TR19122/c0_g1_i1/m.66855
MHTPQQKNTMEGVWISELHIFLHKSHKLIRRNDPNMGAIDGLGDVNNVAVLVRPRVDIDQGVARRRRHVHGCVVQRLDHLRVVLEAGRPQLIPRADHDATRLRVAPHCAVETVVHVGVVEDGIEARAQVECRRGRRGVHVRVLAHEVDDPWLGLRRARGSAEASGVEGAGRLVRVARVVRSCCGVTPVALVVDELVRGARHTGHERVVARGGTHEAVQHGWCRTDKGRAEGPAHGHAAALGAAVPLRVLREGRHEPLKVVTVGHHKRGDVAVVNRVVLGLHRLRFRLAIFDDVSAELEVRKRRHAVRPVRRHHTLVELRQRLDGVVLVGAPAVHGCREGIAVDVRGDAVHVHVRRGLQLGGEEHRAAAEDGEVGHGRERPGVLQQGVAGTRAVGAVEEHGQVNGPVKVAVRCRRGRGVRHLGEAVAAGQRFAVGICKAHCA